MAHDAYRQGRTRITIGVRRPLDKLRKIVKKSEFDRLFHAFRIRKGFRRSVQEEPAGDDEEASLPDSVRINPDSETPAMTFP
jgi:hypothetical protein